MISRRNKKLAFLLAMMLVLSIFAGCGGQAGKRSRGETATIPVGINVELSGAVASYGSNARDGAVLAIEEINAAGGVLGKQLEGLQRDCKSMLTKQ